MQLCSILDGQGESAAVVDSRRGVSLVRDLLPDFTGDVLELLAAGLLERLGAAAAGAPTSIFRDVDEVTFGAPYRHPRMLWGIGLNYVEHAYAAGVVPVLDQTAEDILQRNPRFLTRSKNFPGFFSFGPRIVPLTEVMDDDGSLAGVDVSTVINGEVHRRNTVSHMRYDPAYLISFHSKVMPLYPGDIISTGTPGAVHIRPGDVAECRIPGVGVLKNPVAAQERGGQPGAARGASGTVEAAK